MNQLKEYLDIHIRWLKETFPNIAPGDDLPSILTFANTENRLTFRLIPPMTNMSKWARDTLAREGAAIYATMLTGHIVPLDKLKPELAERLEKLVIEHDTNHPEVKPYRKECYLITVGDRTDSFLTVFLVKRDRIGRITQMIEQKNPPGVWSGPMVDLLAVRH
jgi:hypothetical protein